MSSSVSTPGTFDLATTFAVLCPGGGTVPVDVTPSIYAELDRRFDGFREQRLVSCHSFSWDWPTWEMHPAGDEVVILLSGRVQFVLDRAGQEEMVELREAGSYVIVPRDTWHTARVLEEAKMVFITPGEGTQNRPV